MTEKIPTFAISPAGAKHELLAQMLSADGYHVSVCEEDLADGADIYITPKAKDLSALFKKGIGIIEYLPRCDFKKANGILTAEAAIAFAVCNTDFALCGSQILIAGSGCIALPLARRLSAMGAFVTLAARNKRQIELARLDGINTVNFDCVNGHFDLVFNTVPAMIFDKDMLRRLIGKPVIIDLASLPGGVDKAEAEALGFAVLPALALPGKYMPKTAAKVIYDSVKNAIKEMTL